MIITENQQALLNALAAQDQVVLMLFGVSVMAIMAYWMAPQIHAKARPWVGLLLMVMLAYALMAYNMQVTMLPW
jgi:apolipoprotein N-acyltransferase